MISTGGRIDFGIKSIFGMADYCHVALSTSVWPAWQLCNIFSVSWTSRSLTSWHAIGCQSRCYFGTHNKAVCKCSKGFWGSECRHVCKGGLIHPCSNRGLCLKASGACSCDINWRGSEKCDACTDGYRGRDCVISVAKHSDNDVQSSTLFSGGYTKTLDGARVKLNGIGEFLAFRSRDGTIETQARLRRRKRSVVVDAAAVRVGRDSVAVASKFDGNVSVSVNGKEINENSEVQLSTTGYTYEKKSHGTYKVKGTTGFAVIIYRKESELDLELNMPRHFCTDAAGILGACKTTLISSSGIIQHYNVTLFTSKDLFNYTMKWKVDLNDSLIQPSLNASGLPLFITSAGSCLLITGNGIVTPELTGVFTSNDVSLQIMFKVSDSQSSGSLISFGRNSTVAIVINGTILVYYGNTTIDTGLVVDSGRWMQLTIVYQRNNRVLQIYVCRSAILIQRRVYIVGGEWFENGSIFGVGLWVAALKTPVPLGLSKFVGYVDDLRVWKIRLDAVTIQAMWGKDIAENGAGLVAGWKMNEGGGGLVKDGIGSHHIMLPSTDSQRPRWIAADYKTSEAVVDVNEAKLIEERISAERTCFGIIFSEVMNKTCLSVIESGANFYFTSCIEGITFRGNTAAYDALLAYSTECKSAGKLSELPGRELCNMMPRGYFNHWYGPNCTRKCVFGTISSVNTTCKCDKGYWGNNCDKICPGGAALPCSGHGACDVITGKCLCDANYQGSLTCDKCSNGWFGASCEYVKDKWTSELQPACSVGEDGRYKAFDLLRFEVEKTGRYLLLKDRSIEVYVDHISCFATSFCINSIVVEESGKKLEIQASPTNIGSLQLKNGNNTIDEIKSNGMLFHQTIVVRQIDPTIIKLQIRDTFSLRIKHNQNFISLELLSVKSACSNLTGLCGSCKTTLDTSPIRFRPVGNVAKAYYALHCLYFEYATIFSNKLSIITSSSVTFDFLVKSCSPSQCGGPLITYASHVSFCISNHITLKVYIGSEVYDTGIATEADQWNQVFVAVSKATLKMDIFIVSSSSVVTYKTFTLTSYPITNGGILSVGSWTPSLKRTVLQPQESFKGEIDELRIWGRSFDFSLVKAKVFSNPRYKATELLAAWKFNEGLGNFTTDLVNGLKLYLPRYPWKRPIWRPSDAPLLAPNFGNDIDDSDIRKNGEVFCTDILVKGPMGVKCARIDEDAKAFYVKQCIEVIVNKGVLSAALSTAISFGDFCQNTLHLISWPAQQLCNSFPGTRFPRWIGDDCTIPCFYGDKDELRPNTCKCEFGYWGDSCNATCDGGFTHPCSDHGICDVRTGKCACYSNWQGDSNCSSCTAGLTGKDCSIVDESYVSKDVTISSGQVGFQGLLLIFGRGGININIPGEFTLLYSSKFKLLIQSRYVPCLESSVCLVAISLKLETHVIIIRAPLVASQNIIVWINGKIRDIYQIPILKKDFGFELTRLFTSVYLLATTHGKLRFIVTGKYLSVQLDIVKEVCDDAVGIIGSCKASIGKVLTGKAILPDCRGNAFVKESVKYQAGEVDLKSVTDTAVQQFVKQYIVKECDSLFIYRYKDVIEYREGNAGYALKFNESAFTIHNTTDMANSKFVTIEFMVHVITPGTILSYGYRTMFVLAVEETNIYVLINEVKYNTTLHIELGSWNQIVIQWDRSLRLLYLSVIYANRTLERNELSINTELFTRQDILTFGKWQPAMNVSNQRPFSTFVGFIDEIKIWSRVFSPALIWQLMAKKVKIDADGLVRLYELNEGSGMKVVEKRSGRTESLLKIPWIRPEWQHSSLVLEQQPRSKALQERGRDTRKSIGALKTCTDLLKTGSLAKSCEKIGQGIVSYYFKSCQDILVESDSTKEALRVVVIYADFCMSTLNLTRWPAQELCSQFQQAQMPLEMYEKCSMLCVYGKESANASCECFNGYWGGNCSHICPGGSFNPCRNNGVCSALNGNCDCIVNWNGSSDCGTCKSGWKGRDCSLAMMTYYRSRSSFYISGGTVALLSGVIIEFRYTGAFVLYEDIASKVRIEVLQLPCHLFKVCTKSIAIRIEARVLIVAVGLNGSPWRAYIDNRLVSLTRTIVKVAGVNGTLEVHLEAHNEVTIKKGIDLGLRIRVFDHELAISLTLGEKDCHTRKGITAYCNKNATNTTSDEISRKIYKETFVGSEKSDIPAWIMLNTKFNGGEVAMYFNGTMAFTRPLCKSVQENSDLTFELLLQPYNTNGVILAYAKTSVFSFFMARSFRISIGSEVLDTGISITTKQWYYAGFVWKANALRLEVYIGKGNTSLERRTFFLGTQPFVTCGWLSFGNWIPSRGMLAPPVTDVAAFRIDEIRIWNKAFDSVMIQQNYRMNILKSYESLTALWKMNEGNGKIITNQMGYEHIYLSEKFAANPVWVLSDANVNSLVSPLDSYSRSMARQSAEVKKYCYDWFYNNVALTVCHGLAAVRDLSYLKCIKDVTVNNYNLSYAVLSVVTFADECQAVLNLTSWPARPLCNSFPGLHFPYWIGDNCDVPCMFGQADWNNRNVCRCDNGYWGENCTNECPGGADSPCNRRGKCDINTGNCKCLENWKGDKGCSKCSQAWSGNNCEVVKISKNFMSCSFMPGGNVISLNGTATRLLNTGEFYLYRNDWHNVTIKALQGYCNSGLVLCVQAVAIEARGNNIKIFAPWANNDKPRMLANGVTIALSERIINVAGVMIYQASKNKLVLTLQDSLKLHVRVITTELSVNLKITNKYCAGSVSVCGSCDGISTQNYTSGAFLLEAAVRVEGNKLSFERDLQTTTRFNLRFEKVGISTNVLSDVYVRRNFTLEIRFKATSSAVKDSTLICYSKDIAFGVIIKRTLQIVVSTNIYDTGFLVEVNATNQVTVVYEYQLRQLTLYFINSKELTWFYRKTLPENLTLFGKFGVVSIGQWISSKDTKFFLPAGGFQGVIETMRIWRRAYSYIDVKALFKGKITVNDNELISLWDFSEGSGSLVRDVVSNVDFYLPSDANAPSWIVSSVPKAKSKVSEDPEFATKGLQEEAAKKCQSLMFASELYNNCKDLGNDTIG